MKKGKRKKKKLGENESQGGPIESKIKMIQNFLKIPPIQQFNFKPNGDGLVKATLKGLSQFSKLFIVACDDESVAQRQVSVSHLLNMNEEA